jgi:uncharacterized protein (TIGR02147 family)
MQTTVGTQNVEASCPEIKSFRLFLQCEYIKRCKVNSRYSLRAYARLLRIDPSTLSQALRGKRTLSKVQQLKLGTRLGLGPMEMARFWDDPERDSSYAQTSSAKELTLDAFQVISDWYHYAIFELVTVKGFSPEPKWIAKKLGITPTEAQIALERLLRLELVQVGEDGRYLQGVPLVTTTGNPFTAVAFRKLQAQVLRMAGQALEEVPMELRDQTSMTMAIPLRRMAEAKAAIKKFRREFCEEFQKTEDRDAVYQLGISFYPLTRDVESQKEEV